MSRPRRQQGQSTWDRRKLLALLITGLTSVALMLLGLALAVYYSLLAPRPSVADPGQDAVTADEDGLIPTFTATAAQPGPLTTERFGEISLPAPTRSGPAGIPTGFPRTSEGALAQLAAIDQVTLQGASVAQAQEVITAWAVPGGPTAETWSGVKAMAELLSSAGLTRSGSGSLVVSAEPEMGLIRDATGWEVVACVDFVVTATMTRTARVATADCQRMAWVGGRWQVGRGPEPASTPSVWPGTAAAREAGYRILRHD